jgi:acyl-CoA reductase-like NAD-dependent aldehyde dehydrogenase
MSAQQTEQMMQAYRAFFPQGLVGSYVAGELIPGEGNDISLVNPATGDVYLTYKDAKDNVAQQACASAVAGQKVWAALSHAERGRLMQEVGRLLRTKIEPLAQLESISAGKPIRDCRGEALRVAEMFEYYGGWTDKLYGNVIPVPSGHLNYTRREPFGVVLQITPWNAPMFTCGWQIAPAICMGNAVLLKPSELTPLSSLAVAQLAEQAGIPKGVINVLVGYGHTIGQAALTHPAVKKVVFVGSPATGGKIAAAAAVRGIPCVLELGGKSANIVFDDADLERASIGAQAAIFGSAGQSCVAGSRLLVQRGIYEKFIKMVAEGARKIRVGDPAMPETEIGPIQNARQYQHIRNMIDTGVREGAQIVGEQSSKDSLQTGFYVRPTVLKNVTNDMAVARTEIFGPVVVAIPFDTEEEAVRIANDMGRAFRVAEKVKAGTFWINMYKVINVASPFGGYDASGHGRSSGVEALQEYTQVKSVWVETAENPIQPFGYSSSSSVI